MHARAGPPRRAQLASMSVGASGDAVLPGDVLRALTCTNFVYPTRALFGAVAPERHIVSHMITTIVYGGRVLQGVT